MAVSWAKANHAVPAGARTRGEGHNQHTRVALRCLRQAKARSLARAMPKALPHPTIVKKKSNKFKKHQSDEYVKVKESWRRPRGIDSRQRGKFRGYVSNTTPPPPTLLLEANHLVLTD